MAQMYTGTKKAQKVWAGSEPVLIPERSNLTHPAVAESNWSRCPRKCCRGWEEPQYWANPSDKAALRWDVFSIPVFPGQPELEFSSDESSPNPSFFRHNIFHRLNCHLWKLFLNSGSSVHGHVKHQQGHNRQTLQISGNVRQLLCPQYCYCSLGTQTSLYC